MTERNDEPRAGASPQRATIFAPGLFAGKVVLVVGGGGGIGSAIAVLFARLGAQLVVAGRSADKLAKVARAIEGAGARPALQLVLNVRQPDAVQAAFDQIHDRFGRLDAVINSAGGQFAQDAIDISAKGWNAVVDTNLNGGWWVMQTAARQWRDQGVAGSIVNIVMPVARGIPQMAHSAAARAGVIALCATVAVEWAPFDIRVNCVAAGTIDSAGLENYPSEVASQLARSNPLQRLGDPLQIAEACAYLVSPASQFTTGSVLTVDGGFQHWGETWPAGRPSYFRPAGNAADG